VVGVKCARCEYVGEDLTTHAADSQHWLCRLCGRSLRLDEPQCCLRCVHGAREDLGAIMAGYSDLPEAAYRLKSGWITDGPHGDDIPLPGGDALVLLAPGGTGSDAASRRGDRSHAADEHRDDAPSVLGVLATWEDDLRLAFGHPPAGKATLATVGEYLARQLGRAAREHPAFDELARDLRMLRQRIEVVTGADDRPVAAFADCFDCGGRLERRWTASGLADDWCCRRCGRTYTGAEYLLACRAKLEGAGAVLTGLEVQMLFGVRPAMLRRWVLRGELAPVDGPGIARFRVSDIQALLADRRTG
jgi:hypothetical protein